jgi:hypothetical protein
MDRTRKRRRGGGEGETSPDRGTFPAVKGVTAVKALMEFLHRSRSERGVRRSSCLWKKEKPTRGEASHRRRWRLGGGFRFPVGTRALLVVSLDKGQECDEEGAFCHKNPQECGAQVSSPVTSVVLQWRKRAPWRGDGATPHSWLLHNRKEEVREVLRSTDSSRRAANGKLTGGVGFGGGKASATASLLVGNGKE